MPLASPIELTFYDDQDEPVKTYSRARIPSYLLDMAISLQKQISEDSEGVQAADALFDFIVEFYGKQFTRDELKQATDLMECMAVVQAVITRASQLTMEFVKANPPGPSPKRK